MDAQPRLLRDWTALYTPFFSVHLSVEVRYRKAYKELHYCIAMSKGTCGSITRKEYAKGKGKNPCGKTVSVDEPYEIYKDERSGFEWRVLKKYQMPHKEAENRFARWFCAVRSPMTFGSWEMGDVYARDVKTYGKLTAYRRVDV